MELKRNKFTEEILSVNIIKNKFNIKHEEEYEERNVYTFIGIDINGNRFVLDVRFETEDSRFFLDVFERFKGKGIKHIYFLIAPNDEKIKRGIKISYGEVQFIESLTMKFTKILQWLSFKSKYSLMGRIKQFYVQDDYQQVKELIDNFKEDYKDNLVIMKLFDRFFNNIENYYSYDKITRQFIFNHRKITDTYFKIKALGKEHIFDNTDIVKNIIFDNIKEIEKNKSYSKSDWLEIINHCDTYCNGLLEKVVTGV